MKLGVVALAIGAASAVFLLKGKQAGAAPLLASEGAGRVFFLPAGGVSTRVLSSGQQGPSRAVQGAAPVAGGISTGTLVNIGMKLAGYVKDVATAIFSGGTVTAPAFLTTSGMLTTSAPEILTPLLFPAGGELAAVGGVDAAAGALGFSGGLAGAAGLVGVAAIPYAIAAVIKLLDPDKSDADIARLTQDKVQEILTFAPEQMERIIQDASRGDSPGVTGRAVDALPGQYADYKARYWRAIRHEGEFAGLPSWGTPTAAEVNQAAQVPAYLAAAGVTYDQIWQPDTGR